MRIPVIALSLAFLMPLQAFADKDGGKGHGNDKHHDKHHVHDGKGVPPGLAKKGGVPPGIAKKFGASKPERPYVAFDPRYDDRAWFLIEGRWVLKRNFDSALRMEVRQSMLLPPVPPPIPLPKISGSVDLRVVLFN